MFGLPPITPAEITKWGATDAISQNIERMVDRSEVGDHLGAVQAGVQAATVALAYGIGATYGLTTKLPLDGLQIALKQLASKPGLAQTLLKKTGLLTASGEAR